MQPKPAFLGQQTASAFQEESVVEAYQQRPPYPDSVFDILGSLVADEPYHVLDVGCGTGFIARRLVGRVTHIDAVDISPLMIEQGKRLPQGNAPSAVMDRRSSRGCAAQPSLRAHHRWR